MLNGMIIVRKEAGYTSHDVVARMRGICGQKKIGHTGTLDPQATGVLPVCLGSGTKLCDMLADRDKEYVAVLRLGVETDTQDMTGRILRELPVKVSEQEVREAVRHFRGEYDQVPPMYSALKVDGRKLYELARAGREVERKARRIRIYELDILEMALPVVRLRVVCSKGTYIRALCADIGERLGCGGVMQSLERTRVGNFRLEEAVTLSQLEHLRDEGRLDEVLWPVDSFFAECPAITVREEFSRLADNGNSLSPDQTRENRIHGEGRWVRVYRQDGRFVGVYEYDGAKRQYRPVKMFLQAGGA